MALQILAACAPTTVIAVDRDPSALALAAEVGASHVVESGVAAADEIRDLTRGRGVDFALDLVGSDDTLALAGSVARPLGHVTLVGLAGGSLPVGFFSPAYEVSVASTYWGSLPELAEVIALAETGKIRAHVQSFPLADAPGAYEAMRAGALQGRAVVVP